MAEPQRKRRALGIRVSDARVEPVDAFDKTYHGTYWFDLRTRRPAAAVVKRIIDVIGSLILILLALPFMLLIIAAIKWNSRGPAVFIQRRIGFRCNEFGMYKFRTMVADAERLQDQLATGGAFFKVHNDPRVTPVGRFLRRFSLDELPQLFNVLEGTMSLVGPRPLLVTDLEKFPLRGQMRRFSVRPGMTGLWQVSGRSLTTEEERMRLDREYVNRWSLRLDLEILARTVIVVLTGRGAA
jgi:lipopolysaccharide/colanic/teichoic acid biosynthesis glycosyltransferase